MKRLIRPFSIFIILSLFITTGQGCSSGDETVTTEPVVLEYWRVFDGEDTFEDIINDYTAVHPNVTINYTKLRYDEYEDQLLRAMAEGRGPDIFSIHNTWMGEYQTRILPMPGSVTVTYNEQRGSLRRETVTVAKEEPTMSMREIEQIYTDQVIKDIMLSYQADPSLDAQDRIYGLPLSVDSLALFYNKDLFNAAGIATPPTMWSEEDFYAKVAKLTTYDSQGEVQQSAIALGRSDNVERASDIVSLLMMQVGAQMVDDRGRITFQNIPDGAPKDSHPTLNALEFYTDFANPTREVYTWNDAYKNSLEAFANGDTAMFIGYSYHIPLIRTVAPKLNFAISGIPQISPDTRQQVNFANYWVEVASSSTENPDWAWDFIMFAADEENVTSYLDEAKRPAANKNLIATQLNDEDLGPFAEQTLMARSWYTGNDATAAEKAIEDLIDQILAGTDEPIEAIELTARRVAETMK